MNGSRESVESENLIQLCLPRTRGWWFACSAHHTIDDLHLGSGLKVKKFRY